MSCIIRSSTRREWLADRGGALDLKAGTEVGLVVETGCRYHAEMMFPDVISAGIRVARIGSSSVRYEVGLFRNEEEMASAEGFFIHVYVDRETRRPKALSEAMRTGWKRSRPEARPAGTGRADKGKGSGVAARVERDLPEFLVVAIHQPNRHLLALAVDIDNAEELQAGGRRQVLALLGRRRLDELQLGAEGHVEIVRAERAGMQRAGDEFPERVEVLELRLVRIVVMRRRVMHVRRQPHRVGDAGRLHEAQQIGNFQLAALGRAVVRIGNGFVTLAVGIVVPDNEAERHVGGNHLPGRLGSGKLALQPGNLLFAQNARLRRKLCFQRIVVRAAIGAHVEEEDIDQRTIAILR